MRPGSEVNRHVTLLCNTGLVLGPATLSNVFSTWNFEAFLDEFTVCSTLYAQLSSAYSSVL